jgi:hypothetical protein
LDEIKVKQVIARKFGYGPQFVDLFVKHRIKKMHEFARQRGFRNSIDVRCDKWGLEKQRKAEEERARKEAREEARVQM